MVGQALKYLGFVKQNERGVKRRSKGYYLKSTYFNDISVSSVSTPIKKLNTNNL